MQTNFQPTNTNLVFNYAIYKAEGQQLAQEYLKKYDLMRAMYPIYRESSEIERLDMVIKREDAEAIIRGDKTVEFRAMSEYYIKRFYDEQVLQFMQEHRDDPLVQECADPLKVVKTIHLHNYNNSWSLEVECKLNNVLVVNEETVRHMQEEHRCYELDSILEQEKDKHEKSMFFYFVLGPIIKRENI